MCSTRSTAGIYLDPDLVLRTLDELAGRWWWKRPVIHYIGGEPFIQKAFPTLLKHATGKGFPVSITTNGVLLAEFSDLLVKTRTKQVTVSVDGPEHLHDTIRGVVGTYGHARDGVRRIAGAGKPRPTIALNCTVSPDNQNRLYETAKDLESWGVDSLTFQHLVFDKDSADFAAQIDPQLVARELTRIKSSTFTMPINIFPPIRESDLIPYYRDLSYPFETRCVMPWLVARVYPGAEVAPCLDLYMGNLKESSFCDIWNCSSWRRFRRMRRKKDKLLQGCLRCCHRQYYG